MEFFWVFFCTGVYVLVLFFFNHDFSISHMYVLVGYHFLLVKFNLFKIWFVGNIQVF